VKPARIVSASCAILIACASQSPRVRAPEGPVAERPAPIDGGRADADHAADAGRVTVSRGFVTRRGRCLVRDGARLRLVGSSAFHLQEESVREALGWSSSRDTVARTFETARRNGVRLLRVAAFNERDGDVATIQSALGTLREPALVALDRVIAEAHSRDILLVMVLSNYWDDYGGLPRYLQWLGLARDYDHRALSMREPRVRAALAQYFRAIVTRRNTVTGRLYGDEPSILAWELMNEPRGTNLGDHGRTFAEFLHELAVAVRSAGARQLIVSGDEGYDADTRGYDTRYWNRMDDRLVNPMRGESFRRVVNDPAIDAATVHWYPDHWTVPSAMAREGGERWLREHVAIADEADKPVLFEEFGLMAPRHPSLAERRDTYDHWFATAFSLQTVAAAMPWGMHWDPAFRERHGFEWGAREGDEDPYGPVVRRWSAQFAQGSPPEGCTRAERAAPTGPGGPDAGSLAIRR
jgi:mannan endo-1,4-beta-mannosidase